MGLQERFEKAVAIVQNLPENGPLNPDQQDKLFFYARYKQATIGKVNTSRPGMLDFVGKAKWDAWKAIEEKSQDDAKKEYVEKLLELLQASGDKASAAEIEAL